MAMKRKSTESSSPRKKSKMSQPAAPNLAFLKPHVLQISAGGDVADAIAAFARANDASGAFVISASGPLQAAAVFDAAPSNRRLIFHGTLNLVSLSATFLASGNGVVNMTVTMSGKQGRVVGGVVAGPVVAAGTVVVVMATFASPVAGEEKCDIDDPVAGEEKRDIDGDNIPAENGGELDELDKMMEEYMNEMRRSSEPLTAAIDGGGGAEKKREDNNAELQEEEEDWVAKIFAENGEEPVFEPPVAFGGFGDCGEQFDLDYLWCSGELTL